jgi:catechol 2,3-dioxygenase-like lactoylglutathione lyase family enzyme
MISSAPALHARHVEGRLFFQDHAPAREIAMLDHAGFPVADYARSKAFYEKALAPLGYSLIMEVAQDENDSPAAGFGADGKPDLWIGGEGGLNRHVHIAIAAKDRASVDAFYRAAIAAGGEDNCGRA